MRVTKNRIKLKNALHSITVMKDWPDWWPVTSYAIQTGEQNSSYLKIQCSKPPSYLVKMVLIYHFGLKLPQQEEKSEWALPIEYRNTSWVLSDWKRSSWNIEGMSGDKKLATEISEKITSASTIFEKMFIDDFKIACACDECSVQNRYHDVSRVYYYYREKAIEVIKNLQKPSTQESSPGNGMSDLLNCFFSNARDLEALTIAAIIFFFARTEVILDACFALGNRQGMQFNDFRNRDWAERVKLFVKVNTTTELNKIFSELSYIRTHYRNRMVHAEPERLYSLKHIGLIPDSFMKLNDPRMKLFSSLSEENVPRIFELFDKFEAELEALDFTQFGLEYAKSGLPIHLDQASVNNLKKSMNTIEEFRAQLEDLCRLQDAFDNMEI